MVNHRGNRLSNHTRSGVERQREDVNPPKRVCISCPIAWLNKRKIKALKKKGGVLFSLCPCIHLVPLGYKCTLYCLIHKTEPGSLKQVFHLLASFVSRRNFLERHCSAEGRSSASGFWGGTRLLQLCGGVSPAGHLSMDRAPLHPATSVHTAGHSHILSNTAWVCIWIHLSEGHEVWPLPSRVPPCSLGAIISIPYRVPFTFY